MFWIQIIIILHFFRKSEAHTLKLVSSWAVYRVSAVVWATFGIFEQTNREPVTWAAIKGNDRTEKNPSGIRVTVVRILKSLAGVRRRLINEQEKIFCLSPQGLITERERNTTRNKEITQGHVLITGNCNRAETEINHAFWLLHMLIRLHHIFTAQIHDITLWDINLQAPAVCFLDLNELKKRNRFTLIWYWFLSLLLQGLQAFHNRHCCNLTLQVRVLSSRMQGFTFTRRAGVFFVCVWRRPGVMSSAFLLGFESFCHLQGRFTNLYIWFIFYRGI